MLQGSDDFAVSFEEADGHRAMATSLPYHSASLPILLTALALALGVPVAALPATAEDMGASKILSLLRRNAGTAAGPPVVGTKKAGNGQPRSFVQVCVAKVLLPAVRSNAALVRRAEAAGVVTGAGAVAAAAATEEKRTPSASGASGGGSEAPEVSEWKRAKRASAVVNAAFWEALVNDPSFRLTCRSPDVVGALVDVLGGTWDEPEVAIGANVDETGDGTGGEEMDAGRAPVAAAAAAAAVFADDDIPVHPPAEILRLVIAEVVSSGGNPVFPSLVRLFNAGAAVMGSAPVAPPSSSDNHNSMSAWHPSPLGKENSALVGVFQRAMLRHLDACCRDVITLAATAVGDSGRRGLQHEQQQQQRSGGAGNAVLNRALSSLAAVAAAVAEAAAEGLLPGVETGHLAVGFLSSVLRQVWSVSAGSSNGVVDGVKTTTLGAYHVVTVVALRRAVQQASGSRGEAPWASRAGVGGDKSSKGSGVDAKEDTRRRGLHEDNDLLEECLLMMAHNFDTLLGEEPRVSALVTGSSGGGGGGLSMSGASPTPRTPTHRSPVFPKPPSPPSSKGGRTSNFHGRDGDDGSVTRPRFPPPLDLDAAMENPTEEAPLTTAGVFAETPAAVPRWSSRFDFRGEAVTPGGIGADPSRLAMTFTAVELAGMGSDGSAGVGGSGPIRVPLINTATFAANPSTGGGRSPSASTSKSLWVSAAAGAAGLVAAADRGTRGGNSVIGSGGASGGEGSDGGVNGLRESLVHRLRGSSGRAFVAGFVAELRDMLLSDNDNVRKLATRLAGALIARRRAAVQELLGEELLSTGFSMLEHPFGGEMSFDPISEDEALAEEARAQAFALWLTGARQEASLAEGFARAADRAYALIPHVSSEDGLIAALSRSELLASGASSGGGPSALARLGSGMGGALGALAAAAPNRKTITVDRVIQRADMIGEIECRCCNNYCRGRSVARSIVNSVATTHTVRVRCLVCPACESLVLCLCRSCFVSVGLGRWALIFVFCFIHCECCKAVWALQPFNIRRAFFSPCTLSSRGFTRLPSNAPLPAVEISPHPLLSCCSDELRRTRNSTHVRTGSDIARPLGVVGRGRFILVVQRVAIEARNSVRKGVSVGRRTVRPLDAQP